MAGEGLPPDDDGCSFGVAPADESGPEDVGAAPVSPPSGPD
jgi:hypothetical protein